MLRTWCRTMSSTNRVGFGSGWRPLKGSLPHSVGARGPIHQRSPGGARPDSERQQVQPSKRCGSFARRLDIRARDGCGCRRLPATCGRTCYRSSAPSCGSIQARSLLRSRWQSRPIPLRQPGTGRLTTDHHRLGSGWWPWLRTRRSGIRSHACANRPERSTDAPACSATSLRTPILRRPLADSPDPPRSPILWRGQGATLRGTCPAEGDADGSHAHDRGLVGRVIQIFPTPWGPGPRTPGSCGGPSPRPGRWVK